MVRVRSPQAGAKPRVLSGMRPTGRLHLGHLVGALENWVQLQEKYDCFFFVADWHALTTDYADTGKITEHTIQMVTDWLAAGLDPEKATFFIQSRVPEHAELHLLLSMITPLGWLERVPSYKEQREQIRDKDLGNYGFLGYPVLQAADILIYRANYVPVGEDQAAHVELTREIARRFNMFYMGRPTTELFSLSARAQLNHLLSAISNGSLVVPPHEELLPDRIDELSNQIWKGIPRLLTEVAGESGRESLSYHKLWPFLARLGIDRYFKVLPEPAVLLTSTPKLPGLDGRKMSKSYGNTIELGDDPKTIRKKISSMLTDPQRKRRNDPGRPEICPVFGYHRRYSAPEVVARVDGECRTAGIGCVECKGLMADHLLAALEPIRERRQEFAAQPRRVGDILVEGSRKAQATARGTLRQAREAMKLIYDFERQDERSPAPVAVPRVHSSR